MRFPESRPAFLASLMAVLVTTALGLLAVVGCGGSRPSADEVEHADAVAKRHLVLAYQVADRSRAHHLRCRSGAIARCNHPLWYPPPRLLQAEVGSAKLHRLVVDLATSTDDVTECGHTYIVSGQTGGRSITLAERTPYDSVWVLHGSPSRHTVRKLSDDAG